MIWDTAFVLVGAILFAEGAILLTMSEESWRRFRDFLTGLSLGQLHTIGIATAAAGALVLFLSLL